MDLRNKAYEKFHNNYHIATIEISEELDIRERGFIDLERANTEMKWVTTCYFFTHRSCILRKKKKTMKERGKGKKGQEQSRILK